MLKLDEDDWPPVETLHAQTRVCLSKVSALAGSNRAGRDILVFEKETTIYFTIY